MWEASPTGLFDSPSRVYATTFPLLTRPMLSVNPLTTPARFCCHGLSATLTSNGAPVVGEMVDFVVHGIPSGSGTTNASGVATSLAPPFLNLPAATYPGGVEARYAGNSAASLGPATATADLTITRALTALFLFAPNPSPSTVGQTVTITAGIYGYLGPPGFIDFSYRLGQTTTPIRSTQWDAAGRASIAVDTLPAGALEIIASFAGDAVHEPSSISIAHTVVKAPTTLHLSSSREPSLTTGPPVFIAQFTGLPGGPTPTGKVEFHADGAPLCRSTVYTLGGTRTQASCGGAPLIVGTHAITATYTGDANFEASSAATLTQTVQPGTYFALDLGFEGEAVALSRNGWWVTGNSEV